MKYELGNRKDELYQIVAVKAIPKFNIRPGDFGGYIADERNLSQNGNAWVSGNAQVCGNALVSGNAQVSGNAWTHSPLYIQGSIFSLTNCKYGHIQIGCLCYSYTEWLKNYRKIGKEQGFSVKEIKEYFEYIKLFKKMGK
jgi:hypothetical protein